MYPNPTTQIQIHTNKNIEHLSNKPTTTSTILLFKFLKQSQTSYFHCLQWKNTQFPCASSLIIISLLILLSSLLKYLVKLISISSEILKKKTIRKTLIFHATCVTFCYLNRHASSLKILYHTRQLFKLNGNNKT